MHNRVKTLQKSFIVCLDIGLISPKILTEEDRNRYLCMLQVTVRRRLRIITITGIAKFFIQDMKGFVNVFLRKDY